MLTEKELRNLDPITLAEFEQWRRHKQRRAKLGYRYPILFNTLATIAMYAVLAGAAYLLCSLINWTWNPFLYHKAFRILFGLYLTILFIILLQITLEGIKEDRNAAIVVEQGEADQG